jgi:hypothetical protein
MCQTSCVSRTALHSPTRSSSLARLTGVSKGHASNLLSSLFNTGYARRVTKGLYVPGKTPQTTLRPTAMMRRVARTIAATLPAIQPVLSSTQQVAGLMHNTPTREFLLLGIAREFSRDVVQSLAAAGIPAQVVGTRADMERLVDLPGRSVVAVLPIGDMRSSEPFLGIRTARPERLLVDLFLGRERLGLPLYREDVTEVGRSLMSDFEFSLSRALDYARRRRAYEKTGSFLRHLVAHDERLKDYRAALS